MQLLPPPTLIPLLLEFLLREPLHGPHTRTRPKLDFFVLRKAQHLVERFCVRIRRCGVETYK